MILEHAVLDLRPECAAAFERAVNKALPLIAATPGFIELEVRPCLERAGRYLLLVRWETVEAHEIGFRKSERYQPWKALLLGFYEPFPTVEHYGEPVTRT
jgi:heme-degrading monooxygenase HmoA